MSQPTKSNSFCLHQCRDPVLPLKWNFDFAVAVIHQFPSRCQMSSNGVESLMHTFRWSLRQNSFKVNQNYRRLCITLLAYVYHWHSTRFNWKYCWTDKLVIRGRMFWQFRSLSPLWRYILDIRSSGGSFSFFKSMSMARLSSILKFIFLWNSTSACGIH